MAEYKLQALRRWTGVTREELTYWIDQQQVIQPDLRKGGGPGRHRLFSFYNVFEVALAKHLANHGIEAERIKRILNWIRWTAGCHRPTPDVPAKPPDADWITFSRPWQRQPMAWLLVFYPYFDVPIVYDAETLIGYFARTGNAVPQSASLTAVDLKAIITDLERKTGDHLEWSLERCETSETS